ncbi:hypothetical protein LTR53_011695 [Teratosphaeriaceae sp. CCFEE 6253]|nr:hypothetical protein LTR53_011695 [Teratosphaeriaceae sp. CCFEE 6253]
MATTPFAGSGAGQAVNRAAPSYSNRRQRKARKAVDPFLELDDEGIRHAGQPSPTDGVRTSRSLLVDLVLLPINMMNMVTLLLSLFLVSQKERQWRLSQHATNPASLWAALGPEPYQDPPDYKGGSSDGSFAGWYRKKKHRAMAKLELHDALEMRGRVLIGLLAWVAFVLLGSLCIVRRLYGWVSV